MKHQSLIQYYEVQTALLRLERRREEITENLKQAKYDLRSGEEKLLNYEGSVRRFFDKLSGKQEEKAEILRRELRKAEAALNSLLREKEALEQNRKALSKQLESLPSPEELRGTDETKWASLEAKFCAEALLPLLEKNHEALMEYRSLMRGNRPEILSVWEQQEICAEPNLRAEQCIPLLNRLQTAMDILGIPFEISSYYRSPAAYLVSPAAKHNRLDRINLALNQVEAMQKKTKELLT